MNTPSNTYALILAGGGGTRLWPKSRKQTPKQFLKLIGNETMLQVTAQRFSKIVPWENIIVVTTHEYGKTVQTQLPEVPKSNIILEPEKKDTALAMLVGALYARTKHPDAILINDAADHVVINETEFAKLVRIASQVATDQSRLVAVGITPTYPSTAFGYIKIGAEVEKIDNKVSLFKVSRFSEKPNAATARAFISTGLYFWNANNYVWSAQALIDAFEKYMPEMSKLIRPLLKLKGDSFTKALPSIYQQAEAISIDYAISEKADNLYLIPGDFGWDDIGEWKVVYELGQKDLAGNVLISDSNNDHLHALAVESQNNLIHADKRLVALLGVNDMIVVDTPEIVMIAPRSRSQEVKKLVERLKSENKSEYL